MTEGWRLRLREDLAKEAEDGWTKDAYVCLCVANALEIANFSNRRFHLLSSPKRFSWWKVGTLVGTPWFERFLSFNRYVNFIRVLLHSCSFRIQNCRPILTFKCQTGWDFADARSTASLHRWFITEWRRIKNEWNKKEKRCGVGEEDCMNFDTWEYKDSQVGLLEHCNITMFVCTVEKEERKRKREDTCRYFE